MHAYVRVYVNIVLCNTVHPKPVAMWAHVDMMHKKRLIGVRCPFSRITTTSCFSYYGRQETD